MSCYDDLGVAMTATEADIKKAYFKKVRQHPPESDSIGFQRVRTAFETLSDPVKRRSYDSTLKHGGRLATLEKEASDFMEEENWSSAENRLKEILLLDPDREAARNTLALCMAYQDRHDDAVRMLEQVIRRVPDNTTYRMNLGHCLLRRAIEEDDDAQCLEAARCAFADVVKMAPHHSDAWLMNARVELRLKRHDAAWMAAERAAAADGKEDIGDLEVFFFMVELAILARRPDRVSKATARIERVTEGNVDAREYATNRLLSLVNQLIEVRAFGPALELQEAASTLDPSNTEIILIRDKLRALVESVNEFDSFEDDESIPEVLRIAIAVWLGERVGEECDPVLRSNVNEVLPLWAAVNGDECRHGIARIQVSYPAIAAQVAIPLRSLHQVAASSAGASTSGARSNGGCAAMILILIGVALLGVSALS